MSARNQRTPTGAISIHAPRTGSDLSDWLLLQSNIISIHAPRTGSDAARNLRASPGPDFNPRSPHGERRTSRKAENGHEKISIHAPRTGSDGPKVKSQTFGIISIHAPRTGSDWCSSKLCTAEKNFNPRSPHGERRHTANHPDSGTYFNPRSPHGERQATLNAKQEWFLISIHAPRTGSDAQKGTSTLDEFISIHAPRTGSDVTIRDTVLAPSDFNPRSPHGERRH